MNAPTDPKAPQTRGRSGRVLLVLLALVVVLAAAVAAVVLFLDSIIKTTVAAVGPKLIGAPVSIETVRLSLLSGSVRVRGLAVGNPQGFNTPSAIEIKDFRLRLQPRSVFSDRVIVEEVLIDGSEITYEMGMPSNIGRILENVEAASGPAEKPTTEELKKTEKPARKVQINHLLITNARIHLGSKLTGGHAAPIPLPTIELKDIGKEKEGKTLGQTLAVVLSAVGEGTMKAVGGAGKLIGKGAKAAGEGVAESAEAVGGAVSKGAESVGHAAAKSSGKVVDSVKGLFGKGAKP
jgi:hypothetical protein